MKKADLQRRVDFLLLQLKMINEIVTADTKDKEELYQNIGSIKYISSVECIKKSLAFIEEYNKQYNFYDKEKELENYNLDEKKGECL